MARLAQLHHARRADRRSQRLEVAEVFVVRIDRADGNRLIRDPLLQGITGFGSRRSLRRRVEPSQADDGGHGQERSHRPP